MSDHLIVIPVHNEAGTIGDVVRGAARHGDVLVVDDGSTDGSSEVALSAGAHVIRLARRGGKGAALRRGLTEALARDAQRVVTMDGDGQHDPDDLPRLLAAAAQAPDALVIGGRLGGIGQRAVAVPLPSDRVAAIRVAGFFINWLTGAAVSDTQSGFRVYPAGVIDAVRPRREGFVLESEMLVGAAARGWRLVEVPVAAIHFAERRSRFRPVRDGTAVGVYLAARIARRWCGEAWLIIRALCRPFTAARRRPRHRDLAEFTASHRHHPAAWAAALGRVHGGPYARDLAGLAARSAGAAHAGGGGGDRGHARAAGPGPRHAGAAAPRPRSHLRLHRPVLLPGAPGRRRARPISMRRLLPRGYLFTVLGIAVGVAGLVALGAMAERISRFIEGGDRFVLGQISVAGEGMGMGAGFTAGGLLRAAKIAEIARVPGVAAAQPQVMLPLKTTTSQFLTLTQELVLGTDMSVPMINRNYRDLPVRAGRFLQAGDRGVAVLGTDFAAARKLGVGGRLEVAGLSWTIVGVLDKTLTAPDRFAMVTIEDARDLWLRRDPLLVQLFGAGGLGRGDLNSGAAVAWQPGEDPDAVARRIQESVAGVNVTIPGEVSRLLKESTAFFSALLLGVGALGLVIGGLSLSNTVTAAVFERIRDFGIKRALGATDLHLLREVLGEALGVSLTGGAAGVAIALGIGWLVDLRILRDGQQVFLFSPRLLLFALAFSVVLGALAAAYATLRIAHLSPAEAIRRGT